MSALFVFEELERTGEVVSASITPAGRAAEIIADAQARSVEIERQARERGIELGREEMVARAEAEMAGPRAAMLNAIEQVAAAQAELVSAVELRSIELAVAIAEKIVGAALEVRPELVLGVVEGALRRTLGRDEIVIEVNPEDVETVRAWLTMGRQDGDRAIDVRAERRVDRGGCIVRTVEGEIDAQLPVQLARVDELLRQTFAEPRT